MFVRVVSWALMLCLLAAAPAAAHFGMVIPQANILDKPGTVQVELRFWHPREDKGMDLAKPQEAGVALAGRKQDLLPALKQDKLGGRTVWRTAYPIKRPGDYIFYMTPQPYWEPGEKSFIIHYTKTVVSALGAESGWDQALGLPIEIIPLTRPYGLYAGNSFSGRVLYKGRPLANAAVEVEFFDPGARRKPIADSYVTQVVKTDAKGAFTWTLPWPGWWGFAALHTAEDLKIKKDGRDREVELGGVLWLYAAPVPGR
ncbi:MAG: DUF4198 domain-containing protein [Desulfarculus sp.]|jgi:cobalt/nickel transport protein|nr:MAG: DUF4198 domain-containing protein [Desulfarculus sp.]